MKSLPIKSPKCISTILAALLCLLSIGSANAEQLNFDFIIIGDPSIPDPSTTYFSGTVTGEIIGLENNASSNPSDVILTSAPAELNVPLNVPFSFKDHGWKLSSFGTITVTDGVITSAINYEAGTANPPDEFYLNVSINDATPNVGVLNGIDFNNKAVANLGGFSGVTYTPVTVPEPSTCAMLLGGFGVLAFWRLRRRTAS